MCKEGGRGWSADPPKVMTYYMDDPQSSLNIYFLTPSVHMALQRHSLLILHLQVFIKILLHSIVSICSFAYLTAYSYRGGRKWGRKEGRNQQEEPTKSIKQMWVELIIGILQLVSNLNLFIEKVLRMFFSTGLKITQIFKIEGSKGSLQTKREIVCFF